MSKTVSIIDGKKYLADVNDHTLFEISYYQDISNNLIIVGIIDHMEESEEAGKSVCGYNTKFGCIDCNGNVVVPICYDRIFYNSGLIEAINYLGSKRYLTQYECFCFDVDGIPICKETKTKYWGWERVQEFSKYQFAIAQKDGKQGLIRKDGSIFLEPEYKSIYINDYVAHFTVQCENNDIIEFLYNKERHLWQRLPINDRFVQKDQDWYLIKYGNLSYVLNLSLDIVIPPYFEDIIFYKEFCVVTKQGKKGLISRTETVTVNGHNVLKPFLRPQYDNIQTFWYRKAIVIKDGKQGVYDAEKESFLIEPCIPVAYEIVKKTLSSGIEAVGYYCRERNEYGYLDMTGKPLFNINLQGERHLSLEPFRKGKALVEGERDYYVFNVDGTYTKEKKHRSYSNYHNYEAERWDALTDGMYGDYPGSDVDYDSLGF